MDSKPWYASVTIWGALLAAFAPVGGLVLHHSVSDSDVQSAAVALAAIGAGAGSLIAIIGRLRATTSIAGGSAAATVKRVLLPVGIMIGLGMSLGGCAEAQNAIAAFDAAAVAGDDRIRGDEAVAIEQLKCRLPYATLMNMSAKYPNYSATVALSCGSLPATPFGTVVTPAPPVISMVTVPVPPPAKAASP